MGFASDVVVDLNTALVREGAVIRVASGTRATETLYLGLIPSIRFPPTIRAISHRASIVEVGRARLLCC